MTEVVPAENEDKTVCDCCGHWRCQCDWLYEEYLRNRKEEDV